VTILIYNYYIQILAQKMQENNYLAEVNRELLNQSNRDALTGLMNRRHYNKVIKRVVAAFDYLKTPFSLIMLDIDHFKSINDTYGHESGDIALKELSTVLLKSVRSDDVVCRMGGEEFAIVLQTDIDTAARRAEVIRVAVEGLNVKEVGKFTVSCGVATYRAGMTEEEIYMKADAMLYEAKNGGRNKVCVDWSA
jgi:diguanylate cyclase (GGDEF)-like protein